MGCKESGVLLNNIFDRQIDQKDLFSFYATKNCTYNIQFDEIYTSKKRNAIMM